MKVDLEIEHEFDNNARQISGGCHCVCVCVYAHRLAEW